MKERRTKGGSSLKKSYKRFFGTRKEEIPEIWSGKKTRGEKAFCETGEGFSTKGGVREAPVLSHESNGDGWSVV